MGGVNPGRHAAGVSWLAVSGGWLQGDLEAEDFELVYEIADLAARVDVGGVVVGAEIVETGHGIGEQVPDDDHDRRPPPGVRLESDGILER